jgi:hypothetical protein
VKPFGFGKRFRRRLRARDRAERDAKEKGRP